MEAPLDPWWNQGLLTHPLAASQAVDAGPRWAPTPAPVPRVRDDAHAFSVSWELLEVGPAELEVELVGDMLVLRAMRDGQVFSRAIPMPKDVDLGRRRDHWSHEQLEVVVPRIRPGVLGRVRLMLAQWLRRIAAWVAPD